MRDTHNRGSQGTPADGVAVADYGGSGRLSRAGILLYHLPAIAKSVHLYYQDEFQVDFTMRRSPGSTRGIFFDFNIKDQDDFSLISIWHSSTPTAPVGYRYYNGQAASTVSGTNNLSRVVTRGDDDTLHVRVQWDGSYVKVFQAASAASLGAVCEADNWCYRSGSFPLDGGWFGFHNSTTEDGVAYVDDVIIRRKDGENWKTEFEEHFEIDGSGCGAQQLTHDKAGNLAYDGLYRYTFDAWNRLSTVSRAFRYDNGTLETASKIATMRYDGLGRRIEKKVENSGDWDCTYRSYYDGHSLVELRNGSGFVLQQFVWGTHYVDELVQIAVNEDPLEGGEESPPEHRCELFYWTLQDANYNVLGVVDAEGTLVERYEYTPYGERQVYRSAGSNDPRCHAPTIESQRCQDDFGTAPYSLCDFGMQGKPFEKECGLYGWNARMYHPRLARAMQPDPLGYPDGMNRFEWERGNPVTGLDPTGLWKYSEDRRFVIKESGDDHDSLATFLNTTWWHLEVQEAWEAFLVDSADVGRRFYVGADAKDLRLAIRRCEASAVTVAWIHRLLHESADEEALARLAQFRESWSSLVATKYTAYSTGVGLIAKFGTPKYPVSTGLMYDAFKLFRLPKDELNKLAWKQSRLAKLGTALTVVGMAIDAAQLVDNVREGKAWEAVGNAGGLLGGGIIVYETVTGKLACAAGSCSATGPLAVAVLAGYAGSKGIEYCTRKCVTEIARLENIGVLGGYEEELHKYLRKMPRLLEDACRAAERLDSLEGQSLEAPEAAVGPKEE